MSPVSLLENMPCKTAIAVVAVVCTFMFWQQDKANSESKVLIKENGDAIQSIQRDYVTRHEMTSAIRDVEFSVRALIEQFEKNNTEKFKGLEQGQAEMRNDIKRLLENRNER